MNVTGTQRAHATWLIKNGAASCASVQIYNAATGETVLWSNTLAVSMWIELDSELQRIRTSTDSGSNWTTNNSNTTGLVPMLQGGETNNITLTGPTTGTYRVTYTARG